MSFPHIYGTFPRYGRHFFHRVIQYAGNTFGLPPEKIPVLLKAARRYCNFGRIHRIGIMPWSGELKSISRFKSDNTCWLSVDSRHEKTILPKIENAKEGRLIFELLIYLAIHARHKGKIGVVASHQEQNYGIQQLVRRNRLLAHRLKQSSLKIGTHQQILDSNCQLIIASVISKPGQSITHSQWIKELKALERINLNRCGLILIGDNRLSAHPAFKTLKGAPKYALNRPIFAHSKTDLTEITEEDVNKVAIHYYQQRLFTAAARMGIFLLTDYIIGTCKIDFVVLKQNHRLAILLELKTPNKKLERNDPIDRTLNPESGWTILRFSSDELNHHLPECVARIRQWHDNPLSS